MALTFEIGVEVQDDKGRTSDFSVNVPTTFNLASYGEFAVGLAQAFDQIINGVIVGAYLLLTVDLSSLVGNVITAVGDIQEAGYFKFRTSENRSVDIKIPAFDEGLVPSGSDSINLTDPAVQAVLDAFNNGIAVTGGTIAPCDVDEDDIVTLEYARESFVPRSS